MPWALDLVEILCCDCPRNTMVRYTYPVHAILLLVGAFLWFLVLIACYSTIAIALFPFSPVIFGGVACMLVSVYEYLISVRKRVD